MTTTTVMQSAAIPPTHKIVFDDIVKNEDGLRKKIMKCHQGYKRSYPGAAESNILQQKLRKLVKYGLRGKRKVVLKKSNDNDSSRTYFLKEDDGDTGLFVKINNAKKVKKQGQTLKLLHRRKEISIATDLFLSSLLYSTNLNSAATVEHILKARNLEVSSRRIQAIRTCIAQHVYSEPILEDVQLTDDESYVEEFDPIEYSSLSSSISSSENDNDKHFEKENANGEHPDDAQGVTEREGEHANEDEHESQTEGESATRDEDMGEYEHEGEVQQSMLHLSQSNVIPMVFSEYKSSNKCKRIKLSDAKVAPSRETIGHTDVAFMSPSHEDYIKTTAAHIEQTETPVTSTSASHMTVLERSQCFKCPDETSITNLDLTNVAAVIEVVSENTSQHQPLLKAKKRKRRIFIQREGGDYHTRSRT